MLKTAIYDQSKCAKEKTGLIGESIFWNKKTDVFD